MELSQRSITGLLRHLATGVLTPTSGSDGIEDATKISNSIPGLVTVVAKRLARLATSVILVIDEVDQIVGKPNGQAGGASALDILFALPNESSAPAIALVAIANAVDLLDRSAMSSARNNLCTSLLFQPYDTEQLRRIVKARLAAAGDLGSAAEKALGKVAMELRVRQVAKLNGDCRPMVQFCEQAVFEAIKAKMDMNGYDGDQQVSQSKQEKPLARPDAGQKDPLKFIPQLPIEQQMLLCTLATGKTEAISLPEICARYKDLCRQLHQPANLASKEQVGDALSSLEQRGLLGLRSCLKSRGSGKRIAKRSCVGSTFSGSGKLTAELAVSQIAMRENITGANPLLKRCLE